MAVFGRFGGGGGLGAISSVGDLFCRLGSQPTKKNCFGHNAAPLASVRDFFGSSGPRLCGATFLL